MPITKAVDVRKFVAGVVGPDAAPGPKRILDTVTETGRGIGGRKLQQMWTGCFGSVWLDVPVEQIFEGENTSTVKVEG